MSDIAELWLTENDPLYTKWYKRRQLEYPYLTERQMRKRQEKEIPASCILNRTLHEHLGIPCEEECCNDKD